MLVHDERRLDLFVAAFSVFRLPEVLQFIADDHSLRHEERESWSFFIQGEQIHFLADLPVISLLGFFQTLQVFVQLCLRREARSVNSLEHLALHIASPVGPCYALQLHSLDLSGASHMRSCTEIYKISLLIERNDFVLRQVFNQLHLVILVLVSHELDGFLPRQLEAFQRIVGLDHLLHFLLDLQKVLIVELMLHIKVIIKSVIDRRSDSQLGIRPQFLHRLCQNVGRRVSIA